MLFATVRQRKIQVKSPSTVIQNGINVDELNLEMDDEWALMDAIVAVFTLKYTEMGDTIVSKEVSKKMLHTFGKPVMVPWECLAKTGQLMVSFTGYVDGEKVMTTMYPDSFWDVVQSGPVTGDETIEPTASLYNQILAAAGKATAAAIAANEAKDQLLQDKANGVFDGADGQNAKVSVGDTQTGNPGSEAEVYATGTDQDLKLNFVIPRGEKGERGERGERGIKGDSASITAERTDRGVQITTTTEKYNENGSYSGSTQTLSINDGKRGTSILSVTSEPVYKQNVVDGQTYYFYLYLSNILEQAGVSEILVGDVIWHGYYHYPVAFVDASKAYFLKRVYIRGETGAKGATGATGPQGKQGEKGDPFTYEDFTAEQLAALKGTDGKDGYTPVKGVDYFDGKDGKDGQDGQPGKDGYTPIKGIDYFDGSPGRDGKNGTSVTVFSVAESAEDGGTNVVTFSDKKTLAVKNGSKGSDGSPGTPGEDGGYYTPVVVQLDKNNVSMLFAASKTGMPSVAAVNVTLPAGPKGEKGETGQTGPAGKDGKTPVKGTDYFTAADKQELVTAVLAALPAAEEASF